MNDSEKNGIMDFWDKYKGAIIGGIIALLLFATGLVKFFVGIIMIVLGVFIGNYIQKNKDDVKEKLRNFIDRF